MLRYTLITWILVALLLRPAKAQVIPTVVNTYQYMPGWFHYPYDMEVNTTGDVWLLGVAMDTLPPVKGLLAKFSDQGETFAWAHQFDDSGIVGDVDIDAQGNAYIAATTYDTTGTSRSNYLVQKLAADGSLLWSRNWTGTGENNLDRATALCVDSEGNVIVTGACESPAFNGFRWVTVKFGPAGDTLWVADHVPPTDLANVIGGMDITTDAADNIYVTGESADDVNGHFATIKYAPDGTQRWLRREGGGVYSRGNRVEVHNDMVVVAGHYIYGQLDSTDIFVARYDTAGTTVWTALFDAPHPTVTTPLNGRESVADLVIDAMGNILVVGTQFTTSGSSNDYTMVKFNAFGNVVWHDHYGPGTGWSDARSAFVDASGNVVVTGMCEGTTTGYSEIRTVKYAADGTLLWEAPYTPSFWDQCQEGIIRWDGADHFYVGASANGASVAQLLLLGYAMDTSVPDEPFSSTVPLVPNPATGTTTIQHGRVASGTRYALHDASGRTVRSGTLASGWATNVDLTTLVPGLYTIHYRGTEREVRLRLVVE